MDRLIQKRPIRKTGDGMRFSPGKKPVSNRPYLPGWVRDFRKNPIPRLLAGGDPAVIFDVYWDLLGLDKGQPMMIDSMEKVNTNPKALRMLNHTSNPSDEPPAGEMMVGLEFLAHLVRMNTLVKFQLNKMHPLIQDDIVKLMGYIKDDGRFPLLYHHHAHACWILLKLGIGGNRVLEKSIYWLVKRQRKDGGWLHRSMVPPGEDPDTMPSCIWTTMEVMNMLIKRPPMLKKIDVSNACKFLISHIEQDNYTSFQHQKNAWNILSIGTGETSMFTGGTLKLMEILAGCHYNMSDHQIQKWVKWLKSIQLDDGYFPREVNKMPIGDEWVTLRALSVYKKLKFQK